MKSPVKTILLLLIGVLVLAGAGFAIFNLTKGKAGGGDADDAGGGAADQTVATTVAVQTAALKTAALHQYVRGYGSVIPAPATADQPAAGVALAAPAAGIVARVAVVEGQQVKAGDVLLELNAGAVTVALAKQELQRQQALYAQQNTSLRNLQNAQAQLDQLQVTAPISGTVTRLNARPGGAVDPTTVVAEVMDLTRLAVRADIPAGEAAEVKAGQELKITGAAPLTAALSYVSPSVDSNNGTVSVWAPLPGDSPLRPGEFVPVQITVATHTNCLAAPAASVVTDDDGQSTVAVVHGDEADQVIVQPGLREDGWVEIQGAGLKAGDVVVTVGAYGLPDKTKIQIAGAANSETAATNGKAATGE